MPIRTSDEQLERILQDEKQVRMLSRDETDKIATQINKKIDFPFLSENIEQVIIVKIVRWLDETVYQLLPNEIYGFIRMASDGIDDEEAAILKTRLTKTINTKVNLPFLSETQEGIIMGHFVEILVDAMKKGMSL